MVKALMVATACLLAAVPDEDLDKAAAKASEMGNYTCTVKIEGGRGAGGSVTLKVQPDSAQYLKGAEVEGYRKGEKLVTKEGDAWKVAEKPQKPAEGGKPDKKAVALAMLAKMKAPHEALKGIGEKIKDVKRADSDGGRCYSGDLTAEAARDFGSGGMAKGDKAEFTGTAKIWTNGDGVITKYEIATTMKAKEKDITKTVTVEISDVGSTKYEVPEDAKKALE